ncbi:MAG: helix-turn-helix domain-containing protein [Alphaproteobacteria bacterium]|nr:helix-turn-helix domain-containing protein [Alphaproteobacteria bacterium]
MADRKAQTSGPDDLENYKDMDVGDILRRTRLHYGQSLKDIENALRIRESQLKAIENGEIEKLPGRVYAIGFVRTYAEYLGLDGAKIAQLFKSQYMDAQPRVELSFPVPASESQTPSSWIVAGSIVIAIAILSGWVFFQGGVKKPNQAVPEVPSAFKEKVQGDPFDMPQQSPPDLSESQTPDVSAPVTEDKKSGLVLKILSDSWVEIKDQDGKKIVSDMLKAGDQYRIPDNPGLTMTLGNAGGVELLIDGKALKSLGEKNEVRSDIPLDTSFLKTLEFKEPETMPEPPDESSLNGSNPAGEAEE